MSERQLFQHVYWPSALSWMFSSLHTSVGFAIIGAVVGEYRGSAAGLGYLIQQAEGTFDTTGVFAGMVILAVFVLMIDWLVTLAERRLLVWRPPAAGGRGEPGGRVTAPSASTRSCLLFPEGDRGGYRRGGGRSSHALSIGTIGFPSRRRRRITLCALLSWFAHHAVRSQ